MNINLSSKFLTKSLVCYLIEKCKPQTEEDTLLQTEECLRFLYLSHLTNGPIPVSQTVDNIWHLLILQTKEYFALCESLPGKTIIHHSSEIYLKYSLENETQNQEKISFQEQAIEAKRQLEWLVSYVKNFGQMKEENIKYWSFAVGLRKKLNLSLEEFNNMLVQLIS